MTNGQNRILVCFYINGNFFFFFLAIKHDINFHPKDNGRDSIETVMKG